MFKRSFVCRAFSISTTSATLPSGVPNGNGLPVYLCEMGSMYLKSPSGRTLDHPATQLGFLIRVVEIDNR